MFIIFRFILTQYLVVIWAINGVRAKKMDDENVPQEIKDFVLAILIIAAITFVVRVAIVIYRYVKKPMNKMSTVTGRVVTGFSIKLWNGKVNLYLDLRIKNCDWEGGWFWWCPTTQFTGPIAIALWLLNTLNHF